MDTPSQLAQSGITLQHTSSVIASHGCTWLHLSGWPMQLIHDGEVTGCMSRPLRVRTSPAGPLQLTHEVISLKSANERLHAMVAHVCTLAASAIQLALSRISLE